MSDTKKPTTSAPLLGGHMGGAGETRTVHVKNFPSTPEAKQCPNYCASCICDQSFGGQRPLCPVHDAQTTITTTTALSLHIGEEEMAEALNFDITKVGQLDTSDWFTTGKERMEKLIGIIHPAVDAYGEEETLEDWRRLKADIRSLQSKLQECEAQNKKMREALEAIGNARYHKDISDMYATSVVGGGQLSEQIVSDLFHDILWRVEEYETIARASLLP